MLWLQLNPASDEYRREEAALLSEQRALQEILQMASLCVARLAILAINIIFLTLFVMVNTDFCGSVFETQVGKLTHVNCKKSLK